MTISASITTDDLLQAPELVKSGLISTFFATGGVILFVTLLPLVLFFAWLVIEFSVLEKERSSEWESLPPDQKDMKIVGILAARFAARWVPEDVLMSEEFNSLVVDDVKEKFIQVEADEIVNLGELISDAFAEELKAIQSKQNAKEDEEES